MGRILFWLMLAVVAFALFKASQRKSRGKGADPAPGAEAMVQCAHCGIHVPESEARRDQANLPYCCEAHLRLGRGPASGPGR
jgi:uncharacterized protein